MQKPNRSSYTAAELLDWAVSKSLLLTPKFQRRGVWQPAARSFFIDTLLREMPVPPIYMRLGQSEKKDKVVREVIDGQQRISAVISYMKDEYALSNSLVGTWKGKKFTKLEQAEQDRIRNYAFNAETFQGISDAEVLEVFSRLNTYSVPLNDQELRNGKFFGAFKQTAYLLAYEHLQFWRNHALFTERGIARMDEAELVSELLIAALAGPQDKKKSIDSFYSKFDEAFPQRELQVQRFRAVMTEIATTTNLGDTEFSRPPLFYSLFCAVYHHRFGVPTLELARPAKTDVALGDSQRAKLKQAIHYLSDALVAAKEESLVEDALLPFISASSSQTDNIKPRVTRISVVYERAFG